MSNRPRISRRLSALSEINVTPLIDLAFVLLIIFMIAAPLLEQTIRLDLPTARAGVKPTDRDVVTLALDANGQLYLEDKALPLSDLPAALARIAERPEEPVMRLRADGSLPYQQVITVISALEEAGLARLSLDTRAE